MRTISLLVVGRCKNDPLKAAFDAYITRIQRFARLQVTEIKEEKGSEDAETIREREAERVLKHISKDHCVLLDEAGTQYSSAEFSTWLKKKPNRLTFIIAGHHGAAQRLRDTVQERISLSRMTMTHQMVRVLFAEQIYRAFTITENIPYHK